MNRPFVINFKNYPEISGDKTVELARAAEMASRSLGSEVIVAPPQAALALVAKSVSIPVICQHVDDATTG
ncbi:MAG TPA: triose-phosphate isomerase, partial [Nitrososphaera sp.]|nr:triose-phosphate isomerase [Nitrososphaera sp.]